MHSETYQPIQPITYDHYISMLRQFRDDYKSVVPQMVRTITLELWVVLADNEVEL